MVNQTIRGQSHVRLDDWNIFQIYRKVSNIRWTFLVGNNIVDHSDVVGASLVAAPTTYSFST